MIKKMPCINCLLLPICKSQVSYEKGEAASIFELCDKCSLIDKYTDDNVSSIGKTRWNLYRRKKVYIYLLTGEINDE